MFVPPLNNVDDRFSIIPGIVQTDRHPLEVNFPFVINGDKYPILDTILKKGTPYVQVIPFKRESWKMSVKEDKSDQVKISSLHTMRLIDIYKRKYWHKKSWK